jgi:hypothetical protein
MTRKPAKNYVAVKPAVSHPATLKYARYQNPRPIGAGIPGTLETIDFRLGKPA